MKARILTIVVTYNGMKWLDRCLGSVALSKEPSDVFVVDNCSTDGTPEYISEHFGEQITLDDIAKEMHLAPTYFSTLFSKTLGVTFISYLSTVRMNYAKQLLVYSDKSVTRICFECGFSSLSHFLREFKKQNGITPTEFRKKRLIR